MKICNSIEENKLLLLYKALIRDVMQKEKLYNKNVFG